MTERHVAAFGEIGLPHRPLEFARRLGHLGRLEVLGRQGQARAAITEVAGCDEETTWVEAYRNLPVVLRGCVSASSPRTMEWSADYLRVNAAAREQLAPPLLSSRPPCKREHGQPHECPGPGTAHCGSRGR